MAKQDPVCLITGANAGVGRMAALGLAQRGATVLLGCRSEERGREAQRAIISASGNQRVYWLELDLADLGSVQAAADDVAERYPALDVLINNAAVYDPTYTAALTIDGFETVFATNYLGHVALTMALLPLLQAAKPGRVISVSSAELAHKKRLRLRLDDLLNLGRKRYDPVRAYYHAKLALETWTLALAQRSKKSKLTANIVRLPAVQTSSDRLKHLGLARRALYTLKRPLAMPPERAAAAYVALALSTNYREVSEMVFNSDLEHIKPTAYARKSKHQAALWSSTMTMIGAPAFV